MASLFASFSKSVNVNNNQNNNDSAPVVEDDGSKGETKAKLREMVLVLTEKNERYEQRFRDVVSAYKSLLKEKEALEESLNALTIKDSPLKESLDESSSSIPEIAPFEIDSGEPHKGESSVQGEQDKIKTLMKTMATIREEKASMETKYLAEKKYLVENHKLAMANLKSEYEGKFEGLEAELLTAKEECSQHKAMGVALAAQLKAMQDTLSRMEEQSEKNIKLKREEADVQYRQRLRESESKAQAARDGEIEALQQLTSATNEHRAKVAGLEEELASVRALLAGTQNRAVDSDTILRLKQDIRNGKKALEASQDAVAELKKSKEEATKQFTQRIEELEKVISNLTKYQEEKERTRLLQEVRLTELTALVGQSSASKAQDSAAIKKLNDEMSEVEEENRNLRAALHVAQEQNIHHVAQLAKMQTLLQKQKQLQAQLQNRNEQALHLTNPQDIASTTPPTTFNDKEQKPENDSEPSLQTRKPSLQVDREVQGHVSVSSPIPPSSQEALVQAIAMYEKRLEDMKHDHEVSLESIQKARQRTLEMIDERDKEIIRLKHTLKMNRTPDPTLLIPGSPYPPSPEYPLERDKGDFPGPALDQLSTGFDSHRRFASFDGHFAGEIVTLKNRIRELETLIEDFETRDELSQGQAQLLKEEIRRLERNANRESVNLEYLKNVVLRFIEAPATRSRMLPAVAAVLQLSPSEIDRIKNI